MEKQSKLDGCSVSVIQPDDWDRSLAIVLAHGAGQSMDSPFMSYFHAGGARLGYLTVKFNFPYMEQGRRAPDSQKRLRETYSHVLEWVRREFGPRGIVAGGKSMGGRVASYIVGDVSWVRGLVFLGYPLHPPGRQDRLRDEHLYALSKPMLFVSGTRDSLARKDLLEGVVGRLPHATLHWIEGGDHSFRVRKSEGESLPGALDAVRVWAGRLRVPDPDD